MDSSEQHQTNQGHVLLDMLKAIRGWTTVHISVIVTMELTRVVYDEQFTTSQKMLM